MRALLAIYPRAWRRRYGAEFAALLEEQRPSPGLVVDVVLGAVDAHLDPQVADDGEPSLRRRMKDVVMNSLRTQRVLMAIGLSLPVVYLVAGYLVPDIRYGPVVTILPFVIALATGLLVGRWWAPFPFVAGYAVWLALGTGASAAATYWMAQLLVAWTGFCLIGVAVRALLARDLAHLRSETR